MDENFPFQGFFFFKSSIPGGISINNKHLLILDGLGSDVTLEVIEQARKFGLDMVTLLSHTFQPLDVACFKSFKITFRRERNTTIVTRNYVEPDKITLAGWVNKTLNKTFIRKNIISGFKATRIWPFNPKSMDNKTSPNSLYTLQN
jgi:hypothetical protein